MPADLSSDRTTNLAAVTGTARKTPSKPANAIARRDRQGDHEGMEAHRPPLDPRLQDVAFEDLDGQHDREHRDCSAEPAVAQREQHREQAGQERPDERDVGTHERQHQDRGDARVRRGSARAGDRSVPPLATERDQSARPAMPLPRSLAPSTSSTTIMITALWADMNSLIDASGPAARSPATM